MSRRHITEVELIEYADGEMSPAAAYAAEEHLRQCDLCAGALAASRRTALSLSRLDTLPAPVDLRSRVCAKLTPDLTAALTCQQALPLLHAYVDRCLSPIAVVQLHGHVESCASCRQELAALETMTGLVRSLAVATAPAEVRERVAVAARKKVGEAWWAPRLRPALATAGVVAVGVLALLMRPGTQLVKEKPATIAAANPSADVLSPLAPMSKPDSVKPAPAPVEIAEAPPAEPGTEVQAKVSAPSYARSTRPVRQFAARRFSRTAAPRVTLAVVRTGSASPRPLVAARTTSSPVPAAMQVLRQVAQTAGYDVEARRAMIQAAESIPILTSEDNLDRVPEFTAAAPDRVERPVSTPPASTPSGKQPSRNSASTPDEPIIVSAGPLV